MCVCERRTERDPEKGGHPGRKRIIQTDRDIEDQRETETGRGGKREGEGGRERVRERNDKFIETEQEEAPSIIQDTPPPALLAKSTTRVPLTSDPTSLGAPRDLPWDPHPPVGGRGPQGGPQSSQPSDLMRPRQHVLGALQKLTSFGELNLA